MEMPMKDEDARFFKSVPFEELLKNIFLARPALYSLIF